MSDQPGNASQNQQQQQQQYVTVNLQNSSNPPLETQILELHSAGRQLGRMADVLGIVLDALAGNAALTLPAAANAIGDFREMQNQIASVKHAGAPDRFIAELEALRRADPAASDAVVSRLRAWLGALPATA
jgi:hypothetical protein